MYLYIIRLIAHYGQNQRKGRITDNNYSFWRSSLAPVAALSHTHSRCVSRSLSLALSLSISLSIPLSPSRCHCVSPSPSLSLFLSLCFSLALSLAATIDAGDAQGYLDHQTPTPPRSTSGPQVASAYRMFPWEGVAEHSETLPPTLPVGRRCRTLAARHP